MPDSGVQVTAKDLDTGEEETSMLDPSSYILICGERCYVSHQQFYPKTGTTQITIK